jgi:DNA repair exonuclease SbcCD ATPase subunit
VSHRPDVSDENRREAQLRQRELKTEIQALAVRHVTEVQELEEAAKMREDELAERLRSVENQLQTFESKAREALEREKRDSLAKQESLVAQIEQSQRHLEKVLELYAQEKAKNKGPTHIVEEAKGSRHHHGAANDFSNKIGE